MFLNQESAREQDSDTGLPGELPTLSAVEKSFIAQLISGPNKDVRTVILFYLCTWFDVIFSPGKLLKKTAPQVSASDESSYHPGDLSGMQLALAERQSQLTHKSRSAIPVVLKNKNRLVVNINVVNYHTYEYTFFSESKEDVPIKKITEQLLAGPSAPVEMCYKPQFLRLKPPLHQCDSEVDWYFRLNVGPFAKFANFSSFGCFRHDHWTTPRLTTRPFA